MARVDDATPTYRGYRRQALYALFRLFESTFKEGGHIRPEGSEDLAIYDVSGQLVEVVQVKDHSDNLTASSFKPTFYKRIARNCAPGSRIKVTIASFGPIGPELESATDGDLQAITRAVSTMTRARARQKMIEDASEQEREDITDEQARQILSHVTLCKVTESDLTDFVIRNLKQLSTGVDATQAFEILMWWLFNSSEKRLFIDRDTAINKVSRVGQFLSRRAAYHDEWFTTIVPIESKLRDGEESTRLVDSFFLGGRVRFDHVDANLDVPRNDLLTRLHSCFSKSQVVVVHSASGQGKTTLAYRYAKQFAPSAFRFEVLSHADVRHARRAALAIIGHAEAVEVPTFIYVDVRPGDLHWIEFVRQLFSVNGLQILVTIREEDWARASISASDFIFTELTLSFDEHDALAIYNQLAKQSQSDRHLDFEDAWAQFGSRKTLFEFVYFITQAESLAERIGSQITQLENAVLRGERGESEIELLRLVSAASAYEARLELAPLVDLCQLCVPERTLTLFANEFLVRVSEDGRYVDGFHAIRSQIVIRRLTDPALHPWSTTAARCLAVIVEDDLESFLLCAFSRHSDDADLLKSALMKIRPKSWVGVRSIMGALIWHGIKVYAEENSQLIQEVFAKVDAAFWFTLDWDLAQVAGPTGFRILEHIGDQKDEAMKMARDFQSRQTDKNRVFEVVRHWLSCFDAEPHDPKRLDQWMSLAEVLFWIGHLGVESTLARSFTEQLLEKAAAELPIQRLGEFILAARTCRPKVYKEWFEKTGQRLIERIRRNAAFFALDTTDEQVTGHFVIDIERQSSALGPSQTAEQAASVNDLAMERVTLLSQIFPDRDAYGAIGYGHRTALIPDLIDNAEKSGVLSQYLVARWGRDLNSLARGFIQHQFRPPGWREYFMELLEIRQRILVAFEDLRGAMSAVRSKARPQTVMRDPSEWDACCNVVNKSRLFPISAVDEWGFVSEWRSTETADGTRESRYSAVSRFKPIHKAVERYCTSIANFMTQAIHGLVLIPQLSNVVDDSHRARILGAFAPFKITEHSIHLSVINGLDACDALQQLQQATRATFGLNDLPGTGEDFCDREQRVLQSTMAEWCEFCYGRDVRQRSGNAGPKRRPLSTLKEPVKSISDLLRATRNRIRESLRTLKKRGIDAHILSETIPWNGKSAMWISCDTSHPLSTEKATGTLWDTLVLAFRPDQGKIARTQAIELLWKEIVVVPLVWRKTIARQAMPYFEGVTHPGAKGIDQTPWRLARQTIPDDVWEQLKVPEWPAASGRQERRGRRANKRWSDV
jgi:hypothetical protein